LFSVPPSGKARKTRGLWEAAAITIKGVWACLLIAFMLGLCLNAQSPTAAVVGIVRDASGAGITAATVKVRNLDTNLLRQAVSNEDGGFTVPNLTPGPYELVVEKTGFETLRETSLQLQVNQTARMELQLKLGSISQTMEVKAQIPLLNTENATRGDVVVTQEIEQMPLDGRSYTDLALLVPGVAPAAQSDNAGPYTMGGARADNTNFYVDGMDNRDPRYGGYVVNLNLDSIQEFKVETSGFAAEYGRYAGGVMSVVLKSGTNQFHGALFEFLRNDKLDARNFFADHKDELRRNQFGANFGGPVWIPKVYNGRNRTFLFFSWESFRDREGNLALSRVPTPLERQGDFSQTVDAGGKLVPVKDPFAANAVFPGNRIPLNRFNPISAKILPYWPLPNHPNQANNYLAEAPTKKGWDSFSWKIDQVLSSKDNLSLRDQRTYTSTENPFTGNTLGTFGTRPNGLGELAALNHTHLFTATLINEFRFGTNVQWSHETNFNAGHDFASEFGIHGVTTDPYFVGFPLIQVTGEATLGDYSSRPWDKTTRVYQWSNTVTWIKNSHQIKFGGAYVRGHTFQPYDQNLRGTFSFTGPWTGSAFGDFLTGLLNSASRQTVYPQNYLFQNEIGAFVQDDFKVTPCLTLNFGLRWEVPGHQYDKYGRMSGFEPALGKIIIVSDRGVPNLAQLEASMGLTSVMGLAKDYGLPQSPVYQRYRTFAPRFGFAWRPFGGSATVLRGGYGIFNSGSQSAPITANLNDVFPNAINQTVNRVAGNPSALSFADAFLNAGGASLSVAGVEPHLPNAYLQSWNLTVERELKRFGAVEIAYAGSKGTELEYMKDINRNYYSLDMRLPNGTFPRP
jgi:hypothetical protein